MDVSDLLPASLQQQHHQQIVEPLSSSEMSLTPTLQQQHQQQQQSEQQQTMSLSSSATPSPTPPPAPITPTTPRTTTHTPREIPTMYILDDLYDDDYIDQFNSYNTATPTETPDPSVSVQLAPCPICSRTFNPVTLRKHVGICEKMATKRRNVFDSQRQRREGTDLATYPLPKNFGLPEKVTGSVTLTRTKSERGQSPNPQQQIASPIMQRKKPTEEFIRSTARTSMRKLSTSSATDSVATTSTFTRDRMRSSERSLTRRGGIQATPGEQCPHCDRCFGVKAYDRHVEWCKEKALQASIKHQASSKAEENIAKARLEARTKYRAPCLKTKRSLNREKYSGAGGDENDDSPKSLKIGSKAPDLMSMSMTSSITSERKITKTTSGNSINETSVPAARDSANSTPPTAAIEVATATAAAPPPAASTIKHNLKRLRETNLVTSSPSQLKSEGPLTATDTPSNIEIEMSDFRLMGEKMPASGVNKKLKSHSVRAAASNGKTNVATNASKTTAKTKQQHLISSRTEHKLLEADVIHSSGVHHKAGAAAAATAAASHKKTPSDLSLKSKKQTHFRETPATKTSEGGNAGAGGGNRCQQEDLSEKQCHKVEARQVDLAKSINFYASSTTKKGKDKNVNPSLKTINQEPKEILNKSESYTKMTMEEYFNNNNELMDSEVEPGSPQRAMSKSDTFECGFEESLVLGSKKLMTSRKDVKRTAQKSQRSNREFKREDTDESVAGRPNKRDTIKCSPDPNKKDTMKYSPEYGTADSMLMQQSYPKSGTLYDQTPSEDDELDEYEENEERSRTRNIESKDKALPSHKLIKNSKIAEQHKKSTQNMRPTRGNDTEDAVRETKKLANSVSRQKLSSTKNMLEVNVSRLGSDYGDPTNENTKLSGPIKSQRMPPTELKLSRCFTKLSDDISRPPTPSRENKGDNKNLSGPIKSQRMPPTEPKLSRCSTKLSDDISIPATPSREKQASEMLETDDFFTPEDIKNFSDKDMPSDFEQQSYENTITNRKPRSPIQTPNSETDDDDNDVRKSTSKSDTFIKTDTDSEDSFQTPPEMNAEIPNSPKTNCGDLRSLLPNFRTFSPPKRMAKAGAKKADEHHITLAANNTVKLHKAIKPKVNNLDNVAPPKAHVERTYTPRSLVRSLTPPPPPTTTGSLPTTPRSTASSSSRSQQRQAKLETSPIKSLSIQEYRPQRKKVLRQTASCTTSTAPMKAMPLAKETIEIYGVSSAPHIMQPETRRQGKELQDDAKGDENEDHAFEIQIDSEPEELEQDAMMASDEDKLDDTEHISIDDPEVMVIKEPPSAKLERNKSFTVSGLPDNYDPFLSAKRQLEELCSPTTADSPTHTTHTPQLPSLPATPAVANKMSTSFTLGSTTSSPMTTSQTSHTTTNSSSSKTPTLARSSSFRRAGSLRGPRRSPLLTQRVPLFAQKHRPTIQRGLSDEGPISTNFLKPEEYDEMPVRSVCVNDYALTKSPRVVRRDNSASNRKQPLKLNINAANNVGTASGLTPDTAETESAPNTASRYVNKTDSLAVFLKYETELEKLNKANLAETAKKEAVDENANPAVAGSGTATTSPAALANLDGPMNAKELKDKSNNLSKQNSAKNIKADLLDQLESHENLEVNLNHNNNSNHSLVTTPSSTASNETTILNKYGAARLAPLSKPSTPLSTSSLTHLSKTSSTPVTKPTTPVTKPTTPLTKPSTPLTKPSTPQSNSNTLTPLQFRSTLMPLEHIKPPTKPVALSSIFSDKKPNEERKNSAVAADYIDPKLINKCDNLPVNLNKLRGSVFKACDSDTLEPRMMDHFSSSSSESSAPPMKFLPSVKVDSNASNNLNPNPNQQHHQNQNLHSTSTQQSQPQPQPQHPYLSQRNSAEGRNLLKRRMRLGRNQFLYDASPEADSCSADDEANRSSMECDRFIKEHEKAFERFSAANPITPLDAPPFIPPPSLPAEFEDFDFEEFLSSFENDEEQFPLFKDCREFLLNRTSKKQRSMLQPNSNVNVAPTKKSMPPTFPPLTPPQQTSQQNYQFPNLPSHKGLFDSFSLTNRSKNHSMDQYRSNSKAEELCESINQKREIFISIETEQNDLDKSPISPNSIRHMVGNPQCVVEVEVDAHDNKFSKISDDDELTEQQQQHHHYHHQSQHHQGSSSRPAGDFRQMGEEMSANIRQSMEHQRSLVQGLHGGGAGGDHVMMSSNRAKAHKATGTPSGDAYADSDELSSLDGYPLSSPNSRLGVSSKTSADSAYGSLSRQRSSELTNQRSNNSSSRNHHHHHRPLTSTTATTGNNAMMTRPLAEERSRQLSASSSSSSEHALPPIGGNSNYQKQQQQQQQQHLSQLYNNKNNNNNNGSNSGNPSDLLYERNNNFDVPIHPSINATGPAALHSSSGHETPMSSSTQLFGSSSTMSSSMKLSKFCHECGGKFLLEQAKFCMDCGVKRIVL